MGTNPKTLQSSMNLIAGLGNPGKKYARSRHNVGFMVVDALAKKKAASWRDKPAWCAQTAELAPRLLAIKPTTYMNDSGRAVRAVQDYFSIPQNHICLVYDDRDLPLGTIRWTEGFRTGARHNGVRSVAQHIGKSFLRLRFGIGNSTLDHIPLESFVLQPFTAFEEAILEELIDKTAESVLTRFSPE